MAPAAVEQPPAAPLMDVHETASLIPASPRTVTRWSEQGIMPKGRKIGALVRWSRAEVMEWIAAGCPRIEK